jgi:acetyltransferase-like isoleucine patch superfamily enzyme
LGTILKYNHLIIDENVSIGPFCYIQGHDISIGSNTLVRPLTILIAHTIKLGQYVHIAPSAVIKGDSNFNQSFFEVGDHSRIFPFCWLEPGQGIRIGKHVGIGGHTLIFTHGVWPDYLKNGPVSFGAVILEDNVWLPWRVFILPNVTIGHDSIIGGGSIVNRSIPANSLAGGIPARVIKEGIGNPLTIEDKMARSCEILASYVDYCNQKGFEWHYKIENNTIVCDHCISIDSMEHLRSGDILFAVNRNLTDTEIKMLLEKNIAIICHSRLTAYSKAYSRHISEFVKFLRRYGIRMYISRVI